MRLTVEVFVVDIPGYEFASRGCPLEFVFYVFPVGGEDESFVKSRVESSSDHLASDVYIYHGCRKWDDVGCGSLHLVAHDGGFGVGFYVEDFGEGKVSTLFLTVLVAFDVVSVEVFDFAHFSVDLHYDI